MGMSSSLRFRHLLYNIFNMKNQQKGSVVVVLLVIIVVILLAMIGYVYFKQPTSINQAPDNSQSVNTQNTTSNSVQTNPTQVNTSNNIINTTTFQSPKPQLPVISNVT